MYAYIYIYIYVYKNLYPSIYLSIYLYIYLSIDIKRQFFNKFQPFLVFKDNSAFVKLQFFDVKY